MPSDFNKNLKTITHCETYKSNQMKKINKIPEKTKSKTQKQILNTKEKSKIKTNALDDCYSQNNKPLRICRCTNKDLHQEKIENKSKRNIANNSVIQRGDFPKIDQACSIHVKLAYYILHQQQNEAVQNQIKKAIQNHSVPYLSQDSVYKSHNFPIVNPILSLNSHRPQDLNMIPRYPNLVDPYFVMNYPNHSQKIHHFGGFSSNISNDNSFFRTPLAKSLKLPMEIDTLDAEKLMNNFGPQISHKISMPIAINEINKKSKNSETLPDYRIDTVMKTQYRSRVL
uniref:Uncharacterized protein n=1 Tax=Schmidtea mediterranea TaxID=79327 RepID=A0A1S6KMK2_SCHMD|nr:hypothetical protein 55340 [Schmidtea mediterranea]